MEVLKEKESILFELIKQHQPISKYELWKKHTKYGSYSSVWNIVEVLRLKGLITEHKSLSNDNRAIIMLMLK